MQGPVFDALRHITFLILIVILDLPWNIGAVSQLRKCPALQKIHTLQTITEASWGVGGWGGWWCGVGGAAGIFIINIF